ncbi:helix-turn-helix domain-containing protein [Nocardia farcinica]|uniref:MmyB family transcriptional regulator n=1 Tax=Nocardia farcinica TaxID=37329 RepID=UPI00245432AB|nr:helix-turn-helix domain-containing protein [Nocardia farcinica]
MSRYPVHRSSRNHRRARLPSIPTLGTSLRTIRDDHLRLSRSAAQQRHGVSQSYLFDLEADKEMPTLETLDRIITGYDLSPTLRRHLHELRAGPEYLAPIDKLLTLDPHRAALLEHLDALEARDILAAYIDPIANVLACNNAFASRLPGINEIRCVPMWIFSPVARPIIIDWEYEAAHAVATLKPVLGRYRESEQAHELIHHLRPHKDFQRIWQAGVDVAYGRKTSDLYHWRNPATGEPESHLLTISDVDHTQNVKLVTAIRKPYSGPTLVSH